MHGFDCLDYRVSNKKVILNILFDTYWELNWLNYEYIRFQLSRWDEIRHLNELDQKYN